jgi:TolB-like protein/class 3 adenylate cyclase/Tfp pilus assembly protein PilF
MSSEIKTELQLEIGHVLFMDIVDYSTRLIDEQRALRDTLNEIVRSTNQFKAADTAGTLIKSPTGDGMALVFHRSAEEPLNCALEISQTLKVHPELPLRMGVHSGPVTAVTDVNDTTSVAGAGINMAQRVMDCGDAGHILLSNHVAEDLEQYAHWKPHLHDVGECEVKHGVRVHLVNLYRDELGNPAPPEKLKRFRELQNATMPKPPTTRRIGWPAVGAVVLILGALAIATFFFRPKREANSSVFPVSPIPEKSIAVLPFENRTGNPDNAYFADGIQDEILTRLSKIADLKVSSHSSTQNYKSAPKNLPEIGKQLGVADVLEGSVQRSGDTVRVNVQLIKASDDSQLWADTFDRKLTDIFSVESEVAKSIADQLRVKITGQEEQLIEAKPTQNLDAYDAYLHGLAYVLKAGTTPSTTLGAQKHLREAVRLDPKFALAWALLSYVDSVAYVDVLQPSIAVREEARQAAETAVALEPKLGEALHATGFYYFACLKDYDTAIHYLGQAHQFLPNSSQIPESLAYVARRRGEWDRSELYFKEAERLDPRNVSLIDQHAASYIALRRFPEALRKLDQILDITPDDVDALATKAAIAQAEGDLPRASQLLTPLRPNAEDTEALETQVYQTILERNPGLIIPRLQEILARPDPALGYFNGELRFWLGWAQEVAGDHTTAQQTWRQARSELQPFLKEQPENYRLIGDLALINMALGDKAAAVTLSERAMAVIPIEKDAMSGPAPIEIRARVSAQIGEPDRAIAALQTLLATPYESAVSAGIPLTPALLQLDPMFDPLRDDPRFQKLAASPEPKDAKP